MKPLQVVATLAVLVAASVCVRLGFWQLDRLATKRAENARLHAAFAQPPVPLAGALPAYAELRARRVLATGLYDSTRTLVLSDRWRGDSAGVEVFAPLQLNGGGVVLVDRGWMPSSDAIRPRGSASPERGEVRVLALADSLPRALRGVEWAPLEKGSAAFGARGLDADTLHARWPDVAPYVLRALPEPGAPPLPVREPPPSANESMHLSYAIQWFAMATIVLIGALAVRLRGARAAKA